VEIRSENHNCKDRFLREKKSENGKNHEEKIGCTSLSKKDYIGGIISD